VPQTLGYWAMATRGADRGQRCRSAVLGVERSCRSRKRAACWLSRSRCSAAADRPRSLPPGRPLGQICPAARDPISLPRSRGCGAAAPVPAGKIPSGPDAATQRLPNGHCRESVAWPSGCQPRIAQEPDRRSHRPDPTTQPGSRRCAAARQTKSGQTAMNAARLQPSHAGSPPTSKV